MAMAMPTNTAATATMNTVDTDERSRLLSAGRWLPGLSHAPRGPAARPLAAEVIDVP